jgi:hypothetical protein
MTDLNTLQTQGKRKLFFADITLNLPRPSSRKKRSAIIRNKENSRDRLLNFVKNVFSFLGRLVTSVGSRQGQLVCKRIY